MPLHYWILIASTAFAAELAGVRMSDQVTVDGRTLSLNGLGLREATAFKVDVYVAGLYLEQKKIRGVDFARVFLRVWFAPDVPYKDLKAGLLGLKTQ